MPTNPENNRAGSGRSAPTSHEPGPWISPANLFRRAVPAPPPATPTSTTSKAASTAPASLPPRETAEELFLRLRELCATGRVGIELDTNRLMKKDSPVNIEADSNQWAYGLLALSLVLGFALGYKVGLAAGAVGFVLYYTVALPFVCRRIRRRVHEKALEELALWRKLWSFGGVALVANGEEGLRCSAPEDNWLEFVRRQEP